MTSFREWKRQEQRYIELKQGQCIWKITLWILEIATGEKFKFVDST
jgi:hypothetical protein